MRRSRAGATTRAVNIFILNTTMAAVSCARLWHSTSRLASHHPQAPRAHVPRTRPGACAPTASSRLLIAAGHLLDSADDCGMPFEALKKHAASCVCVRGRRRRAARAASVHQPHRGGQELSGSNPHPSAPSQCWRAAQRSEPPLHARPAQPPGRRCTAAHRAREAAVHCPRHARSRMRMPLGTARADTAAGRPLSGCPAPQARTPSRAGSALRRRRTDAPAPRYVPQGADVVLLDAAPLGRAAHLDAPRARPAPA